MGIASAADSDCARRLNKEGDRNIALFIVLIRSKGKSVAKDAGPGADRPTQQKLSKLDVEVLKSLRDVELDFSKAALTGVMGANRSGKSTVLHALACVYSPAEEDHAGYKFPYFFRPNTDSLWSGSKFTAHFSHRIGANELELTQEYSKASDRWVPRYQNRPSRPTRFLMMRESLPEVETFNAPGMVHYRKTERIDPTSRDILERAGQVLNCHYEAYHSLEYVLGARASIGVRVPGGLSYPALSMSSGEQRVFRILETVVRSPKYSLILIDEIDLFLHQDALSRLLVLLKDHCENQKKQLIFTTHFPPVANLYDSISLISLVNLGGKTTKYLGYSYDAIRSITGVADRPLTAFAEDDVGIAIIREVALSVGMGRFVEFKKFGSATNSFALAAGLVQTKNEPSLDNYFILLDGDVTTADSRKKGIRSVLNGTEKDRKKQQVRSRRLIRALKSKDRKAPEQVIHGFLKEVSRDGLSQEDQELLAISDSVVNVPDRHGFVDKIVEISGQDKVVLMSKLIGLVRESDSWKSYTWSISAWLKEMKKNLLPE